MPARKYRPPVPTETNPNRFKQILVVTDSTVTEVLKQKCIEESAKCYYLLTKREAVLDDKDILVMTDGGKVYRGKNAEVFLEFYQSVRPIIVIPKRKMQIFIESTSPSVRTVKSGTYVAYEDVSQPEELPDFEEKVTDMPKLEELVELLREYNSSGVLKTLLKHNPKAAEMARRMLSIFKGQPLQLDMDWDFIFSEFEGEDLDEFPGVWETFINPTIPTFVGAEIKDYPERTLRKYTEAVCEKFKEVVEWHQREIQVSKERRLICFEGGSNKNRIAYFDGQRNEWFGFTIIQLGDYSLIIGNVNLRQFVICNLVVYSIDHQVDFDPLKGKLTSDVIFKDAMKKFKLYTIDYYEQDSDNE